MRRAEHVATLADVDTRARFSAKRATISVRLTLMGCGAGRAIISRGDVTESRKVADCVTSAWYLSARAIRA
jgi:hypothetical protein